MADREPALVRRIIDDLNHGDIIGGPGGGPFLPLVGGELSGPLSLPNGSVANPALQLGASDGTGLSRSVNAVVLSVQGATVLGTFAASAQFYTPLSMLNNRLTQVGDATAAGDALNRRTGDTRYAPGAWQDFVPDPGWTSVLRYRLTPLGMQLEGAAQGAVPANATARIGVLPPGYRPARRQFLPGVVSVGLSFGFGLIFVDDTGELSTWWSIAGANSYIALNGVVAMD
jgi:hypothetical protein